MPNPPCNLEKPQTLEDLERQALRIFRDFSLRSARQSRPQWTPLDITLGLAADVGDLAKKVQQERGLRIGGADKDDIAEELADCLWSILVLADAYRVDLGAALGALERRVRSTVTRTPAQAKEIRS